MLKVLKIFVLAFSVLSIIACSPTPTSESTGQYIDSSALTTKVKAELVDKLGTKGLTIKVKTFKDQVQLSGFVSSAAVKQRAGALAGNIMGVKRVINDLVVK
ncbi:Osmotically-inducible protein Y precursor [Legionella massiliensis]|uniref:Osmotically-inducible protein Y n=1 Tax=Legionella massiliensis TaxID=1034943 RepID=A0A078KSN5_9GAMM|nr:BON domain-containing protein [Legionella massiliensis]CDZ77425.1 Osmotically-inducible protein Y precursor [Legionella massiliensis]CEE13163.1 Osmotically-inducible protein Y precursor [Legionella massiliensis]